MTEYMDALTDLIKKEVPRSDGRPDPGRAQLRRNGGGEHGFGADHPEGSLQRASGPRPKSPTISRGHVRQLSAARTIVSEEQTVSTSRRGGLPLQFVIQAPDLDRLAAKLPDFLQAVNRDPGFPVADVDLKFNSPEVQLQIDRNKAQDLGVSRSTSTRPCSWD